MYAIDWAEVRLPLPDSELAHVDLPLAYRGSASPDRAGPRVTLTARFAQREFTWQGRIVRTEGEIDPKSRMVVAVARIEDPYGRSETQERPPLAVGLFVEAAIEGRLARDVVVLPRAVLRGQGNVWIVDAQDRLELRQVSVMRLERDRVVLASGVEPGERIVLTPLETATDGMHVRIQSELALPMRDTAPAIEQADASSK